MEKQIENVMKKAFFDKIDADASSNEKEHLEKLLEEIRDILKSFVPNRKDVHKLMDKELKEVEWDVQEKLIKWIEYFQAPIHDKITKSWKEKIPTKTSIFLKWYYEHLTMVHEEVYKYRKKLANGENIFNAEVPEGSRGVPTKMKSGF